MFYVDLDPVIFRIGFFQVTYYSLTYILGVLAVLLVLLKASRKKEIELADEEVYDFVTLSFVGMIIGARIFHIVFWGWDYYVQNPLKIFQIWEGGFSFHGGLIGGLIVGLLYTKIKKVSFLKVADILVVPVVFFLALGRIANFFNGEILGVVTNVPWCVVFAGIEGCRHPVQLYAAFGRFALFFVLLVVQNYFRKRKEGLIFWSFVLLISVGRFFLDFFREDIAFYGLQAGQWLSLIGLIVSVIFLFKLYSKK